MSEQNGYTEIDEVSLKELIQILLDYKVLIAVVTAAALILSGIYTFVIAEPVYEARSVLNASPVGGQTLDNDNIESIVNNAGLYPVSNVLTYMEQMQSPQLLSSVIEELDLINDEDELISTPSLMNKLTINNVEETNLVEIIVKDTDPVRASEIANSIAENFIRYIDDAGQQQSKATASKIENQLKLEEVALAEKSQALADFMAESISINELKSEITSLVSQVTNIKANLNNLEVSIASDKEKLEILAPQLTGTDYIVDTLELDTSGKVVGESINLTSMDDNALGNSLIAIEFVNTQNSYISNITRYDAYEVQLTVLEAELIKKQALLVEEEYKYDRLNREVALAKQTYNAYQSRYQEAIVATAAEIGSNNIVISSEAVQPEVPISPNKMMNLSVGTILGALLGVFIAFVRFYWKKA